MAAQPRPTLFTTSITQIEVIYGIAALPAGRRRDALALAADAIFTEEFEGRILPLARGGRVGLNTVSLSVSGSSAGLLCTMPVSGPCARRA